MDEFTYHLDHLKPVVEHRSTGVRNEIDISQSDGCGFTLGNVQISVDVKSGVGEIRLIAE